jgi:uncharacterized protein YkwD
MSGKRPEQKLMPLGVLRWKIPQLALVFSLLVVITVTASTGLLSAKRAEALDSEEQTFLATINAYRAQDGLGPLSENSTLDNDARWMANDMATHNYFSHQDSLGRDPFARMDDLGYGYNTWRGENLVAGTETAAYSFKMWHESPEHNANMLGSHYAVIGIARAYSATSTFGWYWATEFGGEDDSAPPPPAPTAAPEPAAPPHVVEPVITQVPSPPTPEPTASPALTATPPAHLAHSGLVFEGVPPIQFGHATGGSFLSGLLELAPALDRALNRDAVRVVH